MTFNSVEEYLEYIKKQNEELKKKNGIAKSSAEFMANLEWIRKNRIFYNYDGNFNNLRNI